MNARRSAPTYAADALWPGVLGVIGSVVVARVVAGQLLDRLDLSAELYVVAFYVMLFGGLWLTCRNVSRRYGSGRPVDDFGLSWRPSDIWRGALVFLLGRVFQVIVLLPFANHLDRLRRFTEGLERAPTSAFVIFSIVAVVAAPILEELVFRGLLQRSLTARVGNSQAVVIQAGLFGLYHVTPGLGFTNVPYALSLAAAGLALGWAAARWGRLGPSSTAHFFVNATSVAILAGAR
jgi:membrane protease YdiL (CAAX protease family)